jgi:hypothetical protein
MPDEIAYPLTEALRAQQGLRGVANLPPERFPLQAFVGMISDEIETLRELGKSDAEIASLIEQNSANIDAATLAANYAPPEERCPPGQ